jgi:hypothetical protein
MIGQQMPGSGTSDSDCFFFFLFVCLCVCLLVWVLLPEIVWCRIEILFGTILGH